MGRYVLKLDELGLEIAQIAFPAALAFTADPIASLVDTAFIGQIGIPSDHASVFFFFFFLQSVLKLK
jgi:Na+-driven multidrug efflux pump